MLLAGPTACLSRMIAIICIASLLLHVHVSKGNVWKLSFKGVDVLLYRMGPLPYPDSWGHLEKYTREKWPQAGNIEYRWSGQVCTRLTAHGLSQDLNRDSEYVYATDDSTKLI